MIDGPQSALDIVATVTRYALAPPLGVMLPVKEHPLAVTPSTDPVAELKPLWQCYYPT